jgi:hypothetical protein
MFCSGCGSEFGRVARYCAGCGAARYGAAPVVSDGMIARQIETCIIEGEKTNVGPIASKARFWASAHGPKGAYIVAATQDFEVESEQVLATADVQRKFADLSLNALVAHLENTGWEPDPQVGENWYSLRFSRRIDPSDYSVPEQPVVLEPAGASYRKRHLWVVGAGFGAILTSFFLFGSVPFLGVLCLLAGIATLAVTRMGMAWADLSAPMKAAAVPGIVLGFVGLITGYILGQIIWTAAKESFS